MIEIRDLYDKNGNNTHITYHKGEKIPKGFYPMVVMVVIRNSNGVEVARFVSTTNAYTLTDIPLGTYTAEEISAPYGYALNSEKLTFTIEDSHLSHQVNIVNVQEIPVPNTDTTLSAIILAVLGIGVIGMGFKFVKSHA